MKRSVLLLFLIPLALLLIQGCDDRGVIRGTITFNVHAAEPMAGEPPVIMAPQYPARVEIHAIEAAQRYIPGVHGIRDTMPLPPPPPPPPNWAYALPELRAGEYVLRLRAVFRDGSTWDAYYAAPGLLSLSPAEALVLTIDERNLVRDSVNITLNLGI